LTRSPFFGFGDDVDVGAGAFFFSVPARVGVAFFDETVFTAVEVCFPAGLVTLTGAAFFGADDFIPPPDFAVDFLSPAIKALRSSRKAVAASTVSVDSLGIFFFTGAFFVIFFAGEAAVGAFVVFFAGEAAVGALVIFFCGATVLAAVGFFCVGPFTAGVRVAVAFFCVGSARFFCTTAFFCATADVRASGDFFCAGTDFFASSCFFVGAARFVSATAGLLVACVRDLVCCSAAGFR
jgi:hypothetical protein